MRSPALGWLSKYYEYTVAKQNGGGAEMVELFITLTKGMGEPTYGLYFCAEQYLYGRFANNKSVCMLCECDTNL